MLILININKYMLAGRWEADICSSLLLRYILYRDLPYYKEHKQI